MEVSTNISHPILKIQCNGRILKMSPHTWSKFSYFRCFMHDSLPSAKTVTMHLEEDFDPFLAFMKNEPLRSHHDVVCLREQLLMFGLIPNSTVSTDAHAKIVEACHLVSTLKSTWDLLQIGWNEFIDDADLGYGWTLTRSRRILHILFTSLLPLHDYTIDILNIDFLNELKKKPRETMSDREGELVESLLLLFDKKSYPSPSKLILPLI